MTTDAHSKVQARHLKRQAYLYIRQSSLRQVLEHTESTQRQYALKQRAIALGWTHDQIIIVDSDQGLSGASAIDRAGFQTLVAEVGMGRAGIVMGLEVSRLARNSTDWHRLLEICALSDTLILDEDGIYDPAHFNDRLLLGLKGTMSEAELHVLRARLIGGMLNKARRGELQCRIPIGFVYDATGRVVLDPDQQVQQTIRVFFETFRRTGSATATVKSSAKKACLFRAGIGTVHGKARWSGAHSIIRARSSCCITHATPGPSCTGGPTSAQWIGSIANGRRRNGSPSFATRIRATSRGSNSKSIRPCSARTPQCMVTIAGGVRRAKGQRSYRGS
jgi:DNA invertase Pin-like site-specific DNA recombinase